MARVFSCTFIAGFQVRLILLVLSITLLAGCATPESRLRTGLVEAGLSKRQSACMAQRMVDRLSLSQLMRLSSLSKVKEADMRELTVGQFLHNVRALRDPEIVLVTTRAAVGCAIAV
jgi:hypothetical protein